MKMLLTAMSVLTLSATPAFAQEQPAQPAPKCESMPDGTMKCCKKDENEEMVCQMMDHGETGHAGMDHSNMNHSNMNHGDMNHAEMSQDETSEGETDHSKTDHSNMDHSAMTDNQPEADTGHSHHQPAPE
jgi:hypothetical protein